MFFSLIKSARNIFTFDLSDVFIKLNCLILPLLLMHNFKIKHLQFPINVDANIDSYIWFYSFLDFYP